MTYLIEVLDPSGRRVAQFREVPLLEVRRRAQDKPDSVRGLLPVSAPSLGLGYRMRVWLGGALCCDAAITSIRPHWGDMRRLILDRYVNFHHALEIEAERPAREGNSQVSRAYSNRTISAIVKDVINSALGRAHYTVAHTAYPDGAQREYAKFLARKTEENELETGGIAAGQWVGAERIDLTDAYAKDGDTIAGIKVDGAAWPDLRLMLVDAEETTRNSHAQSRHPEVAGWTDEQYAASGYKLRADAATVFLQSLIDTKSIDCIELNPHRGWDGEFDDRVDAFGRYLGLVYGGGECFNAALVEKGLADVYLYKEGAYHVPEMEFKDFFSYTGPNVDSIEPAPAVLSSFDVKGGVFEILTALAYAAGGYIWSVDADMTARFREAARPDHVVFFNPVETAITLGSRAIDVSNTLYFSGSPFAELSATFARADSIEEYGFHPRQFEYFSVSLEEDAAKFAEGALDDLAYPEFAGEVVYVNGAADVRVGDLIELRGEALRRLDRALEGEWGGRFAGRRIGRVKELRHKFTGKRVVTRALLTSPLRSVENPLGFITASQPAASALFQFRLDDADAGVDAGYHLD